MNTTDTKFIEDVTANLRDTYLVNGQEMRGQAVSFLQTCLYEKGWKNLSNFESQLEEVGFKIVEGRGKGNRRARVVVAR